MDRAALFSLLAGSLAFWGGISLALSDLPAAPPSLIELPPPRLNGQNSLEATLQKRRSIRQYQTAEVPLQIVAQLLWAGQGISDARERLRTAPSAGALYPLELYIIAGMVTGLAPGVYHYLPQRHALEPVLAGDLRRAMADTALGQGSVAQAPAVLIITAVLQRTTIKYRARAERYVHMEVGHAAENILLQAAALGYGSVLIGAFHDQEVQQLLALPREHAPIAILPFGRPAGRK